MGKVVWASCTAGRLRGRKRSEYDFGEGGEWNVGNRVT